MVAAGEGEERNVNHPMIAFPMMAAEEVVEVSFAAAVVAVSGGREIFSVAEAVVELPAFDYCCCSASAALVVVEGVVAAGMS